MTPRTRWRALGALAAAPLALILLIAAAAGATVTPNASTPASSACQPPSAAGSAAPAGVAGTSLSGAQVGNARTIYTTGVSMGVPAPGEAIAIATAMQESGLQNLDHGDRDSLGLFQQRPSQGWGSPAQILDPVYASQQFYDHLAQVPGWQNMPLTQAAQAVQRSAYPDAYAQWEPLATQLVADFGGAPAAPPSAAASGPAGCVNGDGSATSGGADPAGYAIPPGTPPQIATVITFALAQLGKPYAWGGTGPDTWDCSGLTMAAYAQIGVQLGRTTYDQVTQGQPVTDPTQLRPGDLVFIPGTDGTPARPGHVGLFVGGTGNGLVLQAPHTGDRVKLSPLDTWRSQIAAVRRILPSP